MNTKRAGGLLWIWLKIGVQSFGGGSATLALIQRAAVDEQRWETPEEFVQDWAICQLAPGINLIALAVLVGRRSGGATGIAAAALGMLLPSAAITALLTAAYTAVQGDPRVQDAIKAIVPATVGVALLAAYRMMAPLLAAGRKEGRFSLLLSLFVLAASGAALGVAHLAPVAILLGGGVLLAVAHWRGLAIKPGSEARPG